MGGKGVGRHGGGDEQAVEKIMEFLNVEAGNRERRHLPDLYGWRDSPSDLAPSPPSPKSLYKGHVPIYHSDFSPHTPWP